MNLLCISGSPIKGGNTLVFLRKAIEPVTDPDVEIEVVELAGIDIADCSHCNWCLKNKDSGRICVQKDDGEEILFKMKGADVLVVASPAYYGRMTGRLAAILDRTRPMLFSRPHRGCMTDKPAVALSVAWGRNSGAETTLLSILWSFLVLEMLPMSHHMSGALYGASGISNPLLVHADPGDKHAVENDVVGILAAQGAVRRAIDLSRRIQRKIPSESDTGRKERTGPVTGPASIKVN